MSAAIEENQETPHLFTCPDDLLQVILGGEALDRGQCLPATPLLDPYMHKSVLYILISTLDCISKWVCKARTGRERERETD